MRLLVGRKQQGLARTFSKNRLGTRWGVRGWKSGVSL
jgi:hypothetical protein